MSEEMMEVQDNAGDISIHLAAPDLIRYWSYGEVTKPETINYRTYKPERDGLFCEKIFGPVKNWECNCGKFKRARYKGVICDRCGVEVTHSRVRRERMGHIELAIPLAHTWFVRNQPCVIGALLGLNTKDLEQVIYYERYVVIDKGDAELEENQLIDETTYQDLVAEGRKFDARMGASAIKLLLDRLDLTELSKRLRDQARSNSRTKVDEAIKHLKIVDAFRKSQMESFRNYYNNPKGSADRDTGKAWLKGLAEAVAEFKADYESKHDDFVLADAYEAFRAEYPNEARLLANQPSWMILDVLPVIPPDLRPLVPLEGGRFATSDLNELYRRVINRNNRLKKLIDIRAPNVILCNEKRMLQEAVDQLFDSGRRSARAGGARPMKSLAELLKGKQGRFRMNLLGKRVDYSGRSVIVVGPELQMHQCGLPKRMALELYKPFIIQRLEEDGIVYTLKSAKKYVDAERPEVWDILEEIIEDHPVMLNRAPTLHRLGIQAFYPKLIEGNAIRLHPLVCTAFNADFDGDQMAVHLPLSFETQLECRVLMLSSNNILHPASGQPIAVPGQDIVLGLYYLTKPRPGRKGEGMHFFDAAEAIRAYENEVVDLNATVYLKLPAGRKIYMGALEKDCVCVREIADDNGNIEENVKAGEKVKFLTLKEPNVIKTTIGRIIFNEFVPNELGYANETFGKKVIAKSIDDLYRRTGNRVTVEYLDNLKANGYKWATRAGSSVAIAEMVIPEEKQAMLDAATQKVNEIRSLYEDGVITDGERYNQIIDVWSKTTSDVAAKQWDLLSHDRDGFNPVYMMADSGARGSRQQIMQLSGMRGLMQKPIKQLGGQEVIENPIKSCFREGLNVMEYFISSHGARKGLADTALKTADAGYLTRRLVDVGQDLVVTEADCGTTNGIEVSAFKDGDDTVIPLEERLLGRAPVEDIKHPVTGEVIVKAGELVTERDLPKISATGLEHIKMRSVLTCDSRTGVCSKCYGRMLASGRPVDLGEAVGVLAAQSIGEPGTQLTLRTFHIGGASSRLTVENNKKAIVDGRVELEQLVTVEHEGQKVVTSRMAELVIYDTTGINKGRYQIPYGAIMFVENNAQVKKDQVMFEWDPYNSPIITNVAGKVKLVDLVENKTFRVERDENTDVETWVVISEKHGGSAKQLRPAITVLDASGNKVGNSMLPDGAILTVKDGDMVAVGSTVAKLPRAAGKTRDITGGLPRVAELFEARKPKNTAVLAPMDGLVSMGNEVRNNQEVIIKSDTEERKVLVPRGVHLAVNEGDRVRAGQKISEGSADPHDILDILGPEEVQRHLVNEIQAVYRLQGVAIADKHIECIVRQMMRKVRITASGDSDLLPGEEISKARLRAENDRLRALGKQPAEYTPMLLGITKASLATDSFISACSFQETTKILTRASIEGQVDPLLGLKENVIMGRLIPCGTGARHLRNVQVIDADAEMEERRRLQNVQAEYSSSDTGIQMQDFDMGSSDEEDVD
ncbi:DNA-directed RNA polymerase subunit beta' [Fibrobacter sp.]|uniref:DNA-directed RNA polymerase subunit beta' n=1 Tax=Fibrobacter sp. TaxID=35828 RepID=UPI0025B92B3C|nr:DNA-directed RNA polymerase subunit beta' [Fibrobacter sp.]MBR2057730.1 DNA-directed RNA polymerase subunit beta' [Fibrobacter sp.]MBR2306557.1 DNA-directed RNA polymerase subunit beta' [Fibrobacter sp.]MBR4007426.1 DNA-directed RNA polymerase subunit beta' [Fibrobacter sp.]